ncbi:Prefoldin beta-like protein [Tothia fuscella]|uniref:Prefoldin beta-like protein n=1 Tax=Tothia fuscella TaxID=1048955 RepID=A0A9P4TWT1_9PEZI|nr:Prefoldin beta-like protein [Tothia fuscella]
MADPQKQLQALTEQYQSLQNELSTNLIPTRQKLDSQHSENDSVRREFSTLPPNSSNQIYKSIGPILLKQDTTDAKAAVDGRIRYIEGEIERVERLIEGVQGKMEGMRGEIYGLQNAVDAAGGGGGVKS